MLGARMRRATALLCGALFASRALPAAAAPADDGRRGLALAKAGDCVAAVPLLERAEAGAHRPATAAALARCHVSLGELLLGWEIFDALAREAAKAEWSAEDRAAKGSAAGEASELDARIPRLTLRIVPPVDGAEVTVAGRPVPSPKVPVRVPPDEKVEVRVVADGYLEWKRTLVLAEGAKKTLDVDLERAAGAPPAGAPNPPGKRAPAEAGPRHWLGARFRGLFVPTFVMNIVADGGTTTYWPGGFLTYTTRVGDVDLVPSIGVTSYALGVTPFKPRDTPDTEWELVESDLVGLSATLDVLYVIPLDPKEEGAIKIGAGFGLGWAFAGDLYRTQSYPASGEPGDPAEYRPCKGPNRPAGTFRYCNQLDKDAHRYGDPDKTWGDGGARPVIYPWLALPIVAFAYRPLEELGLELELGLTLNGFLTGAGLRYGF